MKQLLKLATVALALFVLASQAFAQGLTAPLSGDWSGSLVVSGTTLHLVVHFMPKPDGTLTATFDSVDQGAMGLTFTAAQVMGQKVHLDASGIGASFDGTLDAAGKTITGSWTQGGGALPLTLTRTNKAPALDRPQEPKPPFPYTATDVTFPGGAAGVMLAGTLTVPPGAGPFPAVVLISGSGRNARNEEIVGHKPFLLLADTLTRRGIAVLRYDKRGVGQSTGSYAQATTEDFARDVQAAQSYLKTQPSIDPKRIGLLGHSEGGLIAPLVASRVPDVAFVVLLAGPGMEGEKILLAQSALIAKAEGASSQEIAEASALNKKVFDISEHEADPAVAKAKVEAVVLAALTPQEKKSIGDTAKFAETQSREVVSPWMRYFLTYDPRPALEKTHCPVLALDGSHDLQVPPAEDLAAIASALKAGGNTQVTVQELPNLNHLFQTSKTGSPSEYGKITETMAPVALTTISDWIAAQTGTK